MPSPAHHEPAALRLMDDLSDLTLPLMWSLRRDAMRAFEDIGIRPFKALLLELIAGGLQHPKELSDVLDTVPPTVSAMLRELEDMGLIVREADAEDRRRVRLALTEEGEAFRRELQAAWRRVGRSRYAGLSEAELASLHAVVLKLIRRPPAD